MSLINTHFLTIGASDSRRVQFWESVLLKRNLKHKIIDYKQFINNDLPNITKPTTLRITATGESFEAQKMIMSLGGLPNAQDLVFKKGLIYPNTYWYRGWCILLQKIEEFVRQNPLLKIMNTPAAIQLCFHKLRCQQFLETQNIPTPKIILDQVRTYDSLIAYLQKENIHQVFIKPYHGSSASGVMAFRQNKDKQMLYTTIALKPNGELYNHLRLQKYSSISTIKTIIEKMISTDLLVEEWIRKKTYEKQSVDFRILVINGKAAFVVPRMSQHFITNLHLGNIKGNIAEVEKTFGKALIQNAKNLAIQAVQSIDGLFYAGVDVAISESGKSYVLEVNAFGDLLLNITQEGLSTYEYELEQWMEYNNAVNGCFARR